MEQGVPNVAKKKKKMAHVSSLGNNQSRCSTAVTKGGKGFCFSISAGSNVPTDGFKIFNAKLKRHNFVCQVHTWVCDSLGKMQVSVCNGFLF